MLHPEKRPAFGTQRRMNNSPVESTNAELVADAISQVGYNGIERPSTIRRVTGGETENENPAVSKIRKTMGDGTKSKNDKTKEEKKIEKKEKQKKRKQQEKFEKDEQWKNMLDMQGSDKLNDVKVNVVTSDARKADESTKVYTVMSASQAKGLNPVIPIRVAKKLGRNRKQNSRPRCSSNQVPCST